MTATVDRLTPGQERRTPEDRVDPQALIEEARRLQRRRWRRAVTTLSVLVLLAGLVTLGASRLWRGTAPTSHKASSAQRRLALAAPMPRDVVAWTNSRQIVVVSSHTGKVLRTLATNVDLEAPGLPNLSVAPDGMVYFDSVEQGTSTGDQIYRVPIAGGPMVHIAAGFDPQVSPDGRQLAFIAPEPNGQVPYLDSVGGIAVGHLSMAGITGVRILHPSVAQLNRAIMQLSWSPNSAELSYDQLNGTTDVTTFWKILVSPRITSLASAQQIPITNQSLTWNGFWSEGRSHTSADGLGVLTASNGSQKVVTIDPTSGRVLDTLFNVRGTVCVALNPSSPPIKNAELHSPCDNQFNNSVISDAEGSDVLISGATHVIASTGGQSTPYLYRWRVGTPTAIRLTSAILLATWGPTR